MLDFELDERSSYISKVGYYSRCEPHEATREEVLLWGRVKELEALFEMQRPQRVRDILKELESFTIDSAFDHFTMNIGAQEFALLRAHALDRIQLVTDPSRVRNHILGSFEILDGDEQPTRIWLKVVRPGPT